MSEENKVIAANDPERAEGSNFIDNFITEDLAPGGQYEGMTVHTRFPAGAQRLPAHRPLQGPVHRLRYR